MISAQGIAVADKLPRLLNESMVWEACEVSVMPSIGIAFFMGCDP